MRHLVQSGNVALFAVLLGQFVDCGSSPRTFCGREAGMPVRALLDRKAISCWGLTDNAEFMNSMAYWWYPDDYYYGREAV
jgi:hypothetical protein